MGTFNLSELAIKAAKQTNNYILYDNAGLPSHMVYIPKFNISDVISDGPNTPHPAFIVNGHTVNGIYVSKYQNIVIDDRGYSIPFETPASGRLLETQMGFDECLALCANKGPGWHMITMAELAAISLLCYSNEFAPNGNNDFGKDTDESVYEAIPMTNGAYPNEDKIGQVATGSGPVTWAHDGTESGIWDLNGNISEWIGGIRFVKCELQILVNNNAADTDNSQAKTSVQWKAIKASDGTLLTPNGSGTTSGSVKLAWNSSTSKWYFNTSATAVTAGTQCNFKDVYANTTNLGGDTIMLLKVLGLLPISDSAEVYQTDKFKALTQTSEGMVYAGGDYSDGNNAGIFMRYVSHSRTAYYGETGLRCCYIDPAEYEDS